MTLKYPNVAVQLSGQDSNVFSIMGRVSGAMRREGVSSAEIKTYENEMFSSGSYDEALRTTMRWVNGR